MAKTITLRLDDQVYETFVSAAKADNRTLSNLIETLALRQLQAEETRKALWQEEANFIAHHLVKTTGMVSSARQWKRADLYGDS